MKKTIAGIVTIVMIALLSSCVVYGQNMDFVQGSFLWQEEEYLMGVPAETACSTLNKNFKTNAVVRNGEGTVLSDIDYVGTGSEVTGAGKLTTVILGDVTGDGKITSTDYIRIKSFFQGAFNLQGSYAKAADVDSSGKITSTDYMQIKKNFSGELNLYEDMKIEPYASEY